MSSLFELALTLCDSIYGDHTLERSLALMDELDTTCPQQDVTQILQFFYHEEGFSQSGESYFLPVSSNLPQVLVERQGTALCLALIVLELLERRHYEVALILFPVQCILRIEQHYYNPLTGEPVSLHTLTSFIQGTLGNHHTLEPHYLIPSNPKEILALLLRQNKHALISAREYEAALSCLQLLIELEPEDTDLKRDRGYLYTKIDCPDLAVPDFTAFIEANPDDELTPVLQIQVATLSHKKRAIH